MKRKESTAFPGKGTRISAAGKTAALVLAALLIMISGGDAAAQERIFPAVVENIPSANIRLDGGKIIAEQKGFCVLLFNIEKGTKTEIELAHNEGEAPGQCVISSGGIFMKSENMTIEKIAGEWKLFGGRVYDFSGRPLHELSKKENEKPKTVSISAANLPKGEEKIEDLRVRWLGEKTVAITNGERLFYYCIESGALTEKDPANREVQSI